jgi:hypothetical protein
MSQNHFHLPDRTSWVPFSLAPGNRTTLMSNPEAFIASIKYHIHLYISYFEKKVSTVMVNYLYVAVLYINLYYIHVQ